MRLLIGRTPPFDTPAWSNSRRLWALAVALLVLLGAALPARPMMARASAPDESSLLLTPPTNGVSKEPGFIIAPPWAAGESFQNNGNYGGGLHVNYTSGPQDYYALDLALYYDPVYPVAPGQVLYAGSAGGGYTGYGTIVVVEHQNDYQSLYAHLDSTAVSTGDIVDVTTQIGTSGSSGTTAAHLHFALYEGASMQSGNYPGGGQAVVPEPFARCTKDSNYAPCVDIVHGTVLHKELTAPAAVQDAQGRLTVLARGSNDQLWYKTQNCALTWADQTTWSTVAGSQTWTSAPAAATDAAGQIYAFMRGQDGANPFALFYAIQTDAAAHTWSAWTSLGGQVIGTPSVVYNRIEGRIEVFARWSNNELYRIWQTTNGWSAWTSLGGALAGDPVATVNGHADPNINASGYGRPKVFIVGSDYNLYSIQPAQDGSWTPNSFTSQYLATVGKAALNRNTNGRIEFFVRDFTDTLRHVRPIPSGVWQDAYPRGETGALWGSPAAGQGTDGLQVFGRSQASLLQLLTQQNPNNTWPTTWTPLNHRISSDLAVTRAADSRLKVFARQDGQIVYVGQDPGNPGIWQIAPLGQPGNASNLGTQPGGACTLPPAGQFDDRRQHLQWDPVVGATHYEVFYWRAGAPSGGPYFVTGTTLDILDHNLVDDAEYQWIVVARFANGAAIESAIWDFTYQRYPFGIDQVGVTPSQYITQRDRNELFDGLDTHPNYAIVNYDPGPVVTTLTFHSSVTLTGFSAVHGGAAVAQGYRWTIEAQQAGSSSFQTIVSQHLSNVGRTDIPFSNPVTALVFRLTHERLQGDSVEHILEITPNFAAGSSGGTIAGKVWGGSNGLANAPVQLCAIGGVCRITTTDALGRYSANGLAAGGYKITAYPPATSIRMRYSLDTAPLPENGTLSDQDLALDEPIAPPPGTTVAPQRSGGYVPIVYWRDSLTLTTQNCPSGGARYAVYMNEEVIRSGTMSGSGPYSATVALLTPYLGYARIEITCLGTNSVINFHIYIDPSGWVRTTDGAPISGATVTLYRSDSPTGPFTQVPSGSALMSPMNRTNPDTTDTAGHFGWDVVAGYYQVRAQKAGCHAPGNPAQPYVDSYVMTIPPPVTDLDLRLACPPTLRVQYYPMSDESGPFSESLGPDFNLVNSTTSTVPLKELKIRYYFTREGTQPLRFKCWYTDLPYGCSSVTGTFVTLNPALPGATTYLEVGFTKGSLPANGETGEIYVGIYKQDWSDFDQRNDYSFDGSRDEVFSDWDHMTLYRNSVHVWGTPPQ